MSLLANLQAEHEAKSQKIQELFAKGDAAFTSADAADVKTLGGELSELETQIKDARAAEELRVKFEQRTAANRPQQPGRAQLENTEKAGDTYLEQKNGSIFVTDEGEHLMDEKTLAAISTYSYKCAFRNYLRKTERHLGATDLKTLQEGVDTQGGYLVPEDNQSRLVMKRPTPTRLQNFVTRIQTSRDALTMPRVVYATDDIYTTGVRAKSTGEVPASATTHRVTEPVWGSLRIPIYTWMLSMPITRDLIEDAVFPVVGWSMDRFAETIELLYDDKILNGSGIGESQGILYNPGGTDEPASVNIGNSSGGPTWAGLTNLAYSMPEQYEDSLRWCFNKTSTAKFLAGLTDGNQRPLWSMGYGDSGMEGGKIQRRLLGYELSLSGFAPNLATNAYPVVFGDFAGYYMAERVGFSVEVLNELYAETNQRLLLGRLRFGGLVAEPWRLKCGKQA
jgi:HK97 family phage major capsid protein